MESNKDLFENTPINRAVISLVVPTVISQLITVVYNMADTFFIGQIGDPNQVAAASLCMPLFVLLTGMANLFGIGGSSLISRSLGAGNNGKAKRACAFSVWTAGLAAVLYGIVVFLLKDAILPAVGANADTYEFCSQYIFWAITIGAAPTVLNAALAHLVRSEGYAKQASFGMTMGGILNIILDPIFISVFRLEIAGAAIATMLSNLTATIYFIVLIIRKRSNTVLTLNPAYYTLGKKIPFEVLMVGLPSSIMNIMGVFSNVCMNRLMVSY